jgi:hypothetical protein
VREKLGPTYADARWFLILRDQGLRAEAAEVLESAYRSTGDSWLRQILKCLNGRLAPETLVEEADKPTRLCEAFYYAGEACHLQGQNAESRDWFEKCVDTGLQLDPDTWPRDPMDEYELAKWRLITLGDQGIAPGIQPG